MSNVTPLATGQVPVMNIFEAAEVVKRMRTMDAGGDGDGAFAILYRHLATALRTKSDVTGFSADEGVGIAFSAEVKPYEKQRGTEY